MLSSLCWNTIHRILCEVPRQLTWLKKIGIGLSLDKAPSGKVGGGGGVKLKFSKARAAIKNNSLDIAHGWLEDILSALSFENVMVLAAGGLSLSYKLLFSSAHSQNARERKLRFTHLLTNFSCWIFHSVALKLLTNSVLELNQLL